MGHYVAKRLADGVVTIWLVTLLVFALLGRSRLFTRGLRPGRTALETVSAL
jgi:hypothetical protein